MPVVHNEQTVISGTLAIWALLLGALEAYCQDSFFSMKIINLYQYCIGEK